MRRSKFVRPKVVLIFNGAKHLIAITRSIRSATELTKGSRSSISACCIGKHKSSGDFYFRHLHDDVEIEISDLGTLLLAEYDELCGEKRIYYSVRQMAHMRARNAAKKQNNEQQNQKQNKK